MRRGRESWVADERVLGSSEFVRQLHLRVEEEARAGERARVRPQAALAQTTEAVAQLCGLSVSEVSGGSRRPAIVVARAVISHIGVRHWGLTRWRLWPRD